MLTELCAELRNYFLVDRAKSIHRDTYTIDSGTMSPLDFIQCGQYFRITGSVFNDGVWQKTELGFIGDDGAELVDETFFGEVWAMAVPPTVIALADEINEYNKKEQITPYQSESFGGYSYTKGTDANGNAITWQSAFAGKLSRYRRVSVL